MRSRVPGRGATVAGDPEVRPNRSGSGGSVRAAAPRPVDERRARQGRRAAVAVKVLHSVAMVVMAAAATTVLVDGVTGHRDVWLTVSLVLIGVEGVIYLANGRRCPLTKLALRLGDATGHDWLLERLLPEAYVLRVAPFFTWVTLLGLLAMGFRWLLQVTL